MYYILSPFSTIERLIKDNIEKKGQGIISFLDLSDRYHIRFIKNTFRLEYIDIRFLRQFFIITGIIATSHPWLQAYKWCISG